MWHRQLELVGVSSTLTTTSEMFTVFHTERNKINQNDHNYKARYKSKIYVSSVRRDFVVM